MPVAEFDQQLVAETEDNSLPPLEQELQEEPTAPPAPQKPAKPIVGIIYPPPEVRNIVDKTASFVARNGPEFETRIRQNEQNNPKFNFLQPGDPYHAYYQHKVKEIQEGKPTTPAIAAAEKEAPPGVKPIIPVIDEAKKKKQSELLKQVEQPFIPKDPPAEFEFIADPPSISAHDLDVVKLTAQFVARNGRQFLSTLMTREQRNYQFDFLRPQHSLFQYFTKLLEQYTKVLIPPKDILRRLEKDDKKKVLDDVKYRANWIKHQEAQKRREEEEIEKERLAYASIDWHDFVVVETVDYQPFEAGNFPPPTTPQEVGARVLLQDRILQGQVTEREPSAEEAFAAQDDTEVQDMEEDSSSSSEDEEDQSRTAIVTVKQPMPGLPQGADKEEVIIKKGYDPKQPKTAPEKVFTATAPEEYTISPITGERIPVSKLQEHMRIGLLDPRWREQNARQLMERANQESVYAPGPAIEESLKMLAETRSDIFGTGVEETPIGKKVGENRVPGMPWNPNPNPEPPIPTEPVPANPAPPSEPDPSDESKKDSMGQGGDSGAPRPPVPPQPPTGQPHQQGILQPPVPPLPQLPGIIRPGGGLPPPPGQQPPPPQPPGVMLGGIPGVRPLLGMPPGGFGQYAPAPPGTMPGRPPLLAPAPPVLPPNMQPPGGMSMGPPPLGMPQGPPPAAVPQEEEPPTKKAKTEEALIPESQFLATNKSPASFNVSMPSVPDKPEMNLNGQLITFTMALTEPITTLKSKINEAIGLAPGKQKLRLVEGLFFKDTNTLAYYNVGEGATVHLSLKERGGRKK